MDGGAERSGDVPGSVGMEPDFVLTVELEPRANLAMQQNGIPLLRSLTLENRGPAPLGELVLRIRAEPAFARPLELRVAALAPGARQVWEAPRLELAPGFLAELRERLEGELVLEVHEGAELRKVERRAVAVLAYDQWAGLAALPELLCAFVLPNHPALVPWLRRAAALLEQWSGDPSLAGYQSKSRERALRIAAAVFHSLQESGITYVNPPASFERDGQKVRTAERVEREKLATCLDLALLAAGCLEQVGLHALIVVVEEHAFAGLWLDEATFPEPVLDDAAMLAKRVQLGEIAVFDPTLATARPVATFDDALRAARERLADSARFHVVIDVARSRKGGIRPLPLRADGVVLDELDGPCAPAAPATAPELLVPRAVELGDATEAGPLATRIERWKRRLLDLSGRNRLLNFRATKKTVRLAVPGLGALEDALSSGRALSLRARLAEQESAGGRPVAPETTAKLVADEFAAGRLVTDFPQAELDGRLVEIFRAAREGLEEGGASGLYLALGFLEWYESPTSERARRAPLVLVPVDLQRGSIRQGFRLTRAADETRFNTTLLELLKVQHGIEITGLEPLPEDEQGIDVEAVLQSVTAVLRDVPRWRVLPEAQLGFFTFAKFLMWKDLDEQAALLLESPVVKHLALRPDQGFDPAWRPPEVATLDARHPSATVHCPVPADSSQLAAILAAAEGKSFVLEGPPGTGKSQTITNLIAHALALGKTVLFVSEKTAALNVVFGRLEGIGLARFCLELHSNKASKLEVVKRLGEALNGVLESAPAEWESLTAELDRVRAELNAYAEAVGRVHANGLSVFDATARLTTLRGAHALDLGWKSLDGIDAARLATARAELGEATHALAVAGEPHGHALAGVGIEDLAPDLDARIRASGALLRAALESVVRHEALCARLGFDLARASRRELSLLSRALTALAAAPARGAGLLPAVDGEVLPRARALVALGRAHDAARAALLAEVEPAFLALDLAALRGEVRAAEATWFVPRWFATRALRRRFLAVLRRAAPPDLATMGALVERGLALAAQAAELTRGLDELATRTGARFRLEEAPWQALETALVWAEGAQREILAVGAEGDRVSVVLETLARLAAERAPGELAPAIAAVAELVSAADDHASLLRLDDGDPWRAPDAPSCAAAWRARVATIEGGLGGLRTWALWRRLRRRLLAAELGALVRALESGALTGPALATAFERSFHEAWLGEVRAAEPALRDFLSLSHAQRIARFRQLDARCTELTRRVVAARLSARVPGAGQETIPGSELGLLRRQLQLQRRHLGPRQLFQRTRTLVQKLKPCFLMSPMSVAQYLPPGGLAFDLVVFDEASQIPTWDAIGAVARGRQAIVVGDSRQLPPTNFFESAIQDDEDEEGSEASEQVDELESILDECRAAGVPALDLRWHYRSRHESLIVFSNRRYYESRLHTFPAAAHAGLGVQWRHVPEGVYDRGGARTNRIEAEALVREVVARLRDPSQAPHSLGIVTFSRPQQELVEDLLDQERRADPELDRFFVARDGGGELVFVKNLENVQGDERDVILFTIGYGPDAQRHVGMHFGPLNRQGGERRLNVAVTRARRELIVFSTLTADQIDLGRTRARGVADLKAFLAYAQHGLAALPAETRAGHVGDEGFESPLEAEVATALRARGHRVDSQVGCSAYRIDLAIVDPERPGRYLLGIECDGRNYHSSRMARERDRLRQTVLEQLGWRLVRVWSSDWWEAPERELERLSAAIEDARRAPPAPPAPPPVASAPVSPTAPAEPCPIAALPVVQGATAPPAAVAPTLPVYRARSPRPLGSREGFHARANDAGLRDELEAVVAIEGPIALELAAVRVAACFGYERRSARITERIDALAAGAGIARSVQGGRVFLWPRELDARTWRGFRTAGPEDDEAREAEDIAVEELANAGAHLLAENGACPRRELLRGVARLFGFRALGNSLAARLELGLAHLLASGRAAESSGLVSGREPGRP